jgi:uncharacterized membrane protein YhaH (DUF805 family)
MWYYAEGSNRTGPLEASDIENLIADGTVTADTLVWREGMSGWEAASAHFDMTPRRTAPPPVPDVPPAPAAPDGAWDNPDRTVETARVQQDEAGTMIGSDGLYINAPSRTFGEAISICFSKFVSFKGRASRSEYWFFVLFTALLGIVASIFDAVLFPGQIDISPLNSIVTLAVFLPTLSASVRRLHDTDRSGWWIGGMYIVLGIFGVAIGMLIAQDVNGGGGDPEDFIAFFGIFGIVFLIYAIVILVFTIQKGTLGPNRFG